jgi:hypothetical protein
MLIKIEINLMNGIIAKLTLAAQYNWSCNATYPYETMIPNLKGSISLHQKGQSSFALV